MAKRFALSAVLTVRKQREQVEERALAHLNAKCGEVQNTLREIARQVEWEASLRLEQIGQVQLAAHPQASERQLASLRSIQAEMQRQLLVLEQQRSRQQERYISAHAGREMLTELQQRAHEIWEKDESLREQKQLQDLFLSRRELIRKSEGSKNS